MSTRLPKQPGKGDELLAWAVQVQAWLRANQQIDSADVYHQYSSDGVASYTRRKTTAGSEIRPLQLIAINDDEGPGVRVVKGGVTGDTFWYADLAMNPTEDGTDDRPFFILRDEIADGDRICLGIETTWNGLFWRIEGTAITNESALPAPDASHAYLLLGVVAVDAAGLVSVAAPQEWIGNVMWERKGAPEVDGIAVSFYDNFWHSNQEDAG